MEKHLKIKTFQDALDFNGESLEQFSKRTEHDSADEIGYKKCKVICQALNDGEVQDYKDATKAKYYPWFRSVGSGVGFSSYGSYYDLSFSIVGARLLLKNRELAIYAGKQFTVEYNEFING